MLRRQDREVIAPLVSQCLDYWHSAPMPLPLQGAKRTLVGEDQSGIIQGEGKGGNCEHGVHNRTIAQRNGFATIRPRTGFSRGLGVAKRYCTTNSIGDSFLQRRPGTVPFPPAYGPLALDIGHWDGRSQRRCKWLLCGLRFAVSYASTGATSRLDSPMLPRQDPKGTDALWGSMQVRLERSLVECGARRPGTSLRTEIRSRIPTPTGD